MSHCSKAGVSLGRHNAARPQHPLPHAHSHLHIRPYSKALVLTELEGEAKEAAPLQLYSHTQCSTTLRVDLTSFDL